MNDFVETAQSFGDLMDLIASSIGVFAFFCIGLWIQFKTNNLLSCIMIALIPTFLLIFIGYIFTTLFTTLNLNSSVFPLMTKFIIATWLPCIFGVIANFLNKDGF